MKNFSEYEDGLNKIKILKRKSYRHYIVDVEHSNHLIHIGPNKQDYSGGVGRNKNNTLEYYYSQLANFHDFSFSDRDYFALSLPTVSFEEFFETLPADAKLEFSFHLDLFLG